MNLHDKKGSLQCVLCAGVHVCCQLWCICLYVSNVCIEAKPYRHMYVHALPCLSSCVCLQVDCGYICVDCKIVNKSIHNKGRVSKTLKGVKIASATTAHKHSVQHQHESSHEAIVYMWSWSQCSTTTQLSLCQRDAAAQCCACIYRHIKWQDVEKAVGTESDWCRLMRHMRCNWQIWQLWIGPETTALNIQ